MNERHRSWFEFRWQSSTHWCCYYSVCCVCSVAAATAAVTKFNSVFMFISSTMVCLFRRMYLFDENSRSPYLSSSLRAIVLAARSSTKPTANAMSNTSTELTVRCRRQIEINAKLHYVQPVLAHTHRHRQRTSRTNTHSVE